LLGKEVFEGRRRKREEVQVWKDYNQQLGKVISRRHPMFRPREFPISWGGK